MVRDLALEKKWEERFEEYKKSGLRVKAWCAKNGFKTTTFHYWIKRFKEPGEVVPVSKAQFEEVVLESRMQMMKLEAKSFTFSMEVIQ